MANQPDPRNGLSSVSAGGHVDPNWPPPQPKTPNDAAPPVIANPHPQHIPAIGAIDPSWPPPNPNDLRGRSAIRAVATGPIGRRTPIIAVAALSILAFVLLIAVALMAALHGGPAPSKATGTVQPEAAPTASTGPGGVIPTSPANPAPMPTSNIPNAGPSTIVRTQSGRARCVVNADEVVCQSSGSLEQGNRGFTQAPIDDSGLHWFLAFVNAVGAFHWGNGNIPGAHPENDQVLDYGQTYSIAGWAIAATESGTTFTNQRTGHGMFVAIENVRAF